LSLGSAAAGNSFTVHGGLRLTLLKHVQGWPSSTVMFAVGCNWPAHVVF